MLAEHRFARWFANACKETCCWSCQKIVHQQPCEFFCKECHSLLPISVDDYFSLFKQPKSYAIDPVLLDQTYRSYQRQVHPDRFFRSPAQEMRNAASAAQCVNEGYKTLADPIKRGEYFLKLHNAEPPAQVPGAFLMEVMDIHEEVAGTDDPARLAAVRQRVEAMARALQARVAAALKVVDGRVADAAGAAESLAKMKYLARVQAAIKEKLPVDM
jgi:molecular chaperone HscB